MKKNGFTLAEVLITLSIIGVVATLTLPALMTNTAEQQAKTALKKGVNTLTEAAQMNQAIAGFDYASLSSNATEEETQSFYGLLDARTNVNYQLSGTDTEAAELVNNGDGNYVVFFRDGSAVSYNPDATLRTSGPVNAIQDDNIVYGFPIIYDTNGQKGPNILSNCLGQAALLSNATSTNDSGQACTKSNRVIKDQFGLRLRGSLVVPNGNASRWAFEN